MHAAPPCTWRALVACGLTDFIRSKALEDNTRRQYASILKRVQTVDPDLLPMDSIDKVSRQLSLCMQAICMHHDA